MNKLVSVIMPAFNAAKYIALSIESVKKQSYSNWELIIINDGSTDKTEEVIEPYLLKDNRIRYYSQANKGQGAARNMALQYANGDFLAFLDADDLWVPEKLEKQVEILSKNGNIDLLFSSGFIFDETGNIDSFDVKDQKWSKEDGAVAKFIKKNRIPILSVLVKKELVVKAKGFNIDRKIQNAEDYFLWIKLLMTGAKFQGMPDKLVMYRRHKEQATFNVSYQYIKEVNVLNELFYGNMEYKKLVKRSIKQRYYNIFVPEVKPEILSVVVPQYVGYCHPFDAIILQTMLFILPNKFFSFYYKIFHNRIFGTSRFSRFFCK